MKQKKARATNATLNQEAKAFIDHLWARVNYWRNLPDDQLRGEKDLLRARLDGLAFSILSLIDGVNLTALGGYALTRRSPGRNSGNRDFSGNLHELWPLLDPARPPARPKQKTKRRATSSRQ